MFDIKELERIIKDSTLQVQEVDGKKFLSGNFKEIKDAKNFYQTVELNELPSLVDIIKSEWGRENKLFVSVESPNVVKAFSYVDGELERQYPYIAKCGDTTPFRFGNWLDYENFIISLRSAFMPTEERDELLKLIASVKNVDENEISDNGITQTASMKKGAMLTSGEFKAIYTLTPYRTFRDVAQAPAEYLFRISNKSGINFALFEADGGAWKKIQKLTIEDYLKKQFQGYDNITVIS